MSSEIYAMYVTEDGRELRMCREEFHALQVERTRLAEKNAALAAENARLREALQAMLADAVVLSRDYLKAFDHWPTTATIHGWEKAQWLRAADAADQARAALQGATP